MRCFYNLKFFKRLFNKYFDIPLDTAILRITRRTILYIDRNYTIKELFFSPDWVLNRAISNIQKFTLTLFFTLLFRNFGWLSFAIFGTTETFTSSTTWTCPAGVTSVDAEVWGAGGGGGGDGSVNVGGSGGGGGAYSKEINISVTPSSDYTVLIGNGGSAGTNSNQANGGAGGDSYFINTSTVLAKGGGGGKYYYSTPSVGIGGQATDGVGSTKYSGGDGAAPASKSGGGGGGAAGDASDGDNASGTTGGTGGTSGGGNGGNAGQAGTIPGGGGGGASHWYGYSGGVGAGGKCILTYEAPSADNSIFLGCNF